MTQYGKLGIKVWVCRGEVLPGKMVTEPEAPKFNRRDDRRRPRRDNRRQNNNNNAEQAAAKATAEEGGN